MQDVISSPVESLHVGKMELCGFRGLSGAKGKRGEAVSCPLQGCFLGGLMGGCERACKGFDDFSAGSVEKESYPGSSVFLQIGPARRV